MLMKNLLQTQHDQTEIEPAGGTDCNIVYMDVSWSLFQFPKLCYQTKKSLYAIKTENRAYIDFMLLWLQRPSSLGHWTLWTRGIQSVPLQSFPDTAKCMKVQEFLMCCFNIADSHSGLVTLALLTSLGKTRGQGATRKRQ